MSLFVGNVQCHKSNIKEGKEKNEGWREKMMKVRRKEQNEIGRKMGL